MDMEKSAADIYRKANQNTRSAGMVFRVLVINVLVWSSVCAVGSLGNYGDLLQEGSTRTYQEIFWIWLSSHGLMIIFSSTLYLCFQRRGKLLHQAASVTWSYILVLLFFLPLELLYISLLYQSRKHIPLNFSSAWTELFKLGGFTVFLEFAWTTGSFIAILAICTWQQARVREQTLQQSLNDVLRLKLDLEEQRLNALRSQLEPHFIFNCLNAISALVRSDDKRIALTGLNRLSDLLRYALTASSRDWVSFEDELTFIRDYLELQRLRYGMRLQVRIDGVDARLLAGDCPPLLLQPLLENALRHELDCHEGSSDIRMNFSLQDDIVTITVSNPVTDTDTANPGLGLGLPQTLARLRLIYADTASMRSGRQPHDGETTHFEVQIKMPLHMPEGSEA